MTAFDRTVTRVNEIADRDIPDREKLYDYLVTILDTQLADLIRNGELRKSGFTETADLLDEDATTSLAIAEGRIAAVRDFAAWLGSHRGRRDDGYVYADVAELKLRTVLGEHKPDGPCSCPACPPSSPVT